MQDNSVKKKIEAFWTTIWINNRILNNYSITPIEEKLFKYGIFNKKNTNNNTNL